MKVYYCVYFATLVLAIWCFTAVILGFRHYHWASNDNAYLLKPFYIESIIFLLPYIILGFIYAMNVWYLCDEIEYGGAIAEPGSDRTPPLLDLSHITVQDSCIFLIALPLGALIQLFDVLKAVTWMFLRIFCGFRARSVPCLKSLMKSLRQGPGSDDENEDEESQLRKRRKKRGCCYRVCKTVLRFVTCTKSTGKYGATSPEEVEEQSKLESKLRKLRDKRESEAQRLQELESLAQKEKESKEQQRRESYEQAKERQRQVDEEEARRREQQLKDQEQAEKLKEKDAEEICEKEEKIEHEQISTLSVSQFKGLWSSMEAGGSFQCGLKEQPTLHKLSEHLKKQGFHIVFASQNADKQMILGNSSPQHRPSLQETSSATSTALMSTTTGSTTPTHAKIDIEIGICNTRKISATAQQTTEEPWFLARFIISVGSFNAVMKCSDPTQVPIHVKRFLLAKVLKLDTSKPQQAK
jgi:hypothetical protein